MRDGFISFSFVHFQITFLTFASLEFSQSVEPDSDKRQVEYFINNPRSLDYKISGKKDEHRFGVEVKENKQFHHTITGSSAVDVISDALIAQNLCGDCFFVS